MAEPKENGAPSFPELEVSKLHALPSEQQDLFLLTFSYDLVRHVAQLDADGASAQQVYVQKELLKILNLSSPLPTRTIRRNLGDTFAGIFSKGDRKLLIGTINELNSMILGGKVERDIKTKHAAVSCLGDIFGAAGDSAISLAAITTTGFVRLLKLSQNHAGLRGSIYRALGLVVRGVTKSLEETTAKEIWKLARSAAAGEKAHFAQVNACFCLEQLVRFTSHFDNSSDFDKLQNALFKAIDSASSPVRHAAASCLCTALNKSFSETAMSEPVPKIKKPKNAKKTSKLEGEDDPDEPIEVQSPQKVPTTISFSLDAILKIFSAQFLKASTSNRARAGLAICYLKIFRNLGEGVVEKNYGKIALHLMGDVLTTPVLINNRFRMLSARKYVRILLENVIGRQILSETGQLNAARFLINSVLKGYPQTLKERPEPSKQALTAALSALSSLLKSLGSAAYSIADPCRESLLQVLQHPSYTVQVHASACLRSFVLACPQQLLPAVTICMNSVSRELTLLSGPRQSPRRCVGFANGLSAILSTSSHQPLYGSVDVNARVLSQATSLLKSSGSSDLRISSTQIQVAWILIGGLMSLGPNFVKIHLSQLLLLWKNALPKPLNKDTTTGRKFLELSFLAHVRECALGSILTFLEFNSRLLTVDVTKRLASMLQNTTMFLNSLPHKKTTDDLNQMLSRALQLQDFDLMVRRRVLQCYTKLVNLSSHSSSDLLAQANLLPFALTCFADPENYVSSPLSASIASSASTFESIWEVGDNHGFGMTGLVVGYDFEPLLVEKPRKNRHWTSQDSPEAELDRTLLSPLGRAKEYDSITLYSKLSGDDEDLPNSPPTEVVNAAINLFAISLPSQTPKIQESMLEQLSSFISSGSLQRDVARRAALTVNVAVALLSTLKVSAKETSSPPGNLRGQAVEKILQELLHRLVTNQDQYVRFIASEALGRLCFVAGNAFTAAEVNHLIDQIVSNREPTVRSGCAIALGCIHSQLGGMAAGFHMKNILGILMSLSSDPHPTVHFWALDSISKIADSAGLAFSGYVTSALGMLAQLYFVDTHNVEAQALGSSNLEMELCTPSVIARCLDSTINVLGPDLQDATKARDLINTMLGCFETEENSSILIESLRCQEHVSLYAPGYIDFSAYVRQLQSILDSESTQIKDLALESLHNLMRKNTDEVFQTGKPGFEEQLWLLLNNDPSHEVLQGIFRNWLEQSGLQRAPEWVQRCHNILTKTMRKPNQQPEATEQKPSKEPELQDEEVAGFAASAGNAMDGNTVGSVAQELLRWQVRTFAMDCLSDLLSLVAREKAKQDDHPSILALQSKIAEVVRTAFTAATGGVVELRIRGLRIINQFLQIYGRTSDPDFPEANLLEQYQAQIGSALTPAFAGDSSPELAAEAVSVCATFISTGIVTDVERMGRISKLLVSALENFSSESETASIGDLKGLSSNAQTMVKMAVFSAWAELQIASSEQRYLVDIVKPHISRLTPLWLASLKEFARLRFEPDISLTSGPATLSGSLDTVYAAMNRETLLQFYQRCWLNLVDAIASLIDKDIEFVFDALDGKIDASPSENAVSKAHDINYRDEPVAFFFVLFGLAFEALVGRRQDSKDSKERTLEILEALKKILRPTVAGQAIYQEVVFSETMDMLDRLVLTEGLAVQSVIVEIARNLCLSHPSARQTEAVDDEKLSDDIEQLFELTRIIVLVLAGIVPNLTEDKTQARHALTDEAVNLLSSSLSALVDAASIFPSVIKTDLHACILHIFGTILSTGACQATVVPQALPLLKRFVASLGKERGAHAVETLSQVRATVNRFLTILKHAQRRESEFALPCEKNTILALTILISPQEASIAPTDPVLDRTVQEICECLENGLTSKVAASCARSLLLALPRNGTQNAVLSLLLPRLLAFLANPVDAQGLEEPRTLIAHALTTFVGTLPQEQKPTVISLVVPAILARASKEGEKVYSESAARLLETASADQNAFRVLVADFDAEQKKFIEEIIKSGVGRQGGGRGGAGQGKEADAAPAIALKMDFGS